MKFPIAIILFSDIISSSVFSSILGIEQYAKNILNFQKIFRQLSEKHFTEDPQFSNTYVKVNTEGDEGSIFIALEESTDILVSKFIYKALLFAFELKAILEVVLEPDKDKPPQKMHLGTGIHVGEVAPVVDGKIKMPSHIREISNIEGYAINYAKKIESASRIGKFSKIFLSKYAKAYLWNYPIVFEKHQLDIEGISKHEEVFEVSSAFLRDMKIDYSEDIIKKFIEKYVIDFLNLDFIKEPWLKSFVMSVLDSIFKQESYRRIRQNYREKQKSLAWYNYSEDDPILLMMRALDYEEKKQHTRRLSILHDIVVKYPDFVFAKKELIKAITDSIHEKILPVELVYARDIAKEILELYPDLIKDNNERSTLQNIINQITPKLKKYS